MKIRLVDAAPFEIKKSMKSVMMHASKRIWPLWAPASELTLIAGKIEKFERDYEMESFDGGKERQKALWQNFINCDGHLKKFEERSSEIIPLPPWCLEHSGDHPVFRFSYMITPESKYLGLRNYNCTVPFEEILIRKSLLPPSEPISSDAVLKIETELKLERLEAVFAEMVVQGWLQKGAEALVRERFTNSKLKRPIPNEVERFNWLRNIPLLTSVMQIMAIEKSKVYPHFLNKGNELQKGSLKRGLKPTQVDERERARELLKDLI